MSDPTLLKVSDKNLRDENDDLEIPQEDVDAALWFARGGSKITILEADLDRLNARLMKAEAQVGRARELAQRWREMDGATFGPAGNAVLHALDGDADA